MQIGQMFHDIWRHGSCLTAIGLGFMFVAPASAQFSPDNDAQASMADATAAMCPTLGLRRGAVARAPGEDDLNDFCDALVQGQFADTNSVLQSVNGEETLIVQSEITKMRNLPVGQIMGYMEAIRKGDVTGAGVNVASLDVRVGDDVLVGAVGDDQLGNDDALFSNLDWNKLGLFVTGSVRFGDKEETSQSGALSFDAQGITAGANYRLANDLVVGAAFNYSYSDVDFRTTSESPAGQDLDSDSVSLAVFGSYLPHERFFLDGVLTAGKTRYRTERRIFAEDNPEDEAEVEGIDAITKGKFDSFFYGVTAKAGYETRLIGHTLLTPTFQIDYFRSKIDSFRERSRDERADAISLRFSSQKVEAVKTRLGAEISHGFDLPFGTVIPTFRAAYIHQFLDAPKGVRIRYKDDPTSLSEFELPTEKWDRNFGELGANLTATNLPFGLSAALDYATIVGLRDFDVHAINISLQKAFGPY